MKGKRLGNNLFVRQLAMISTFLGSVVTQWPFKEAFICFTGTVLRLMELPTEALKSWFKRGR